MPAALDLAGQRFGRLTALEAIFGHGGPRVWRCVCECGRETRARADRLKNGRLRSCGCLIADAARYTWTTHGLYKSRVYQIWEGIKYRCSNPKHPSYRYYGGRGIKVCERWMSFENFFADMGHKPEGRTLDRINVEGDYEPGNCRWSTSAEQARNRRNTRLYTYAGKTMCLKDWIAEIRAHPDGR